VAIGLQSSSSASEPWLYDTGGVPSAATAANVSGALPPTPRDLSHDGSEHLEKEAGQSKLAHAPITAACSGCVPAEPYPCRSNGTIQHELNKSKLTLEK